MAEQTCPSYFVVTVQIPENKLDRLPDAERIVLDCYRNDRFFVEARQRVTRDLKWPPSSRPFFAGNKLMSDGSGFEFGTAWISKPPRIIPALEAALRSHPCGALSSVRVPSV
jgi:hypothetical protein